MGAAIQQALAYLQLALGIVPLVIQAVKAVEIPGHGPEKLAAVIQIVRDAWEMLPEELTKVLKLDKVEAFAKKVVNTVVLLLNAAGVFTRST